MFSKKEAVEQRIARVFDELDEDGDGTIPLCEVRHLLSDNRRQVNLNDGQIIALLQEADNNRDDVLDLSEFMLLITSCKAQESRKKRILYRVADTVISKTERPAVHTYIDEYNCIPPPIFIVLVSLIQVLTFIVYYSIEKGPIDQICAGCWLKDGSPGPLLFAPSLRKQIWRFFTYQFVHQGLFHLAPNVLLQLCIGIPLELVHKSWRIAPLYLFAVCLGALLQYVLDPSVYLVGCSAGVYALLAAHVSNVIINWDEMPFRIIRVIAIAAFIIFDVGSAVYRRMYAAECERVSYTAHVAGAVTGLLMGIVLLYNLKIIKWERVLMFTCLGIYIAIFLYVVTMCLFVKPFSRPIWETTKCSS